MSVWALPDLQWVRDQHDCGGDHAGGGEATHVLPLHPQAVDLSLLHPKGEHIIGTGYRMTPQDATTELGETLLAAVARIAVREVADRLQREYRSPELGTSLQEGLWKPGIGRGDVQGIQKWERQ